MDAKLIWILISETFRPMEWTWFTICLPPLAIVVTIYLMRQRSNRPDSPDAAPKGAWRRLGRHWRKIGIITIAVALVTGVLMSVIAYKSKKGREQYSERLQGRIEGKITSKVRRMDLIRRSAESLPVETARDVARGCFEKLEGDDRAKFYRSWNTIRSFKRILAVAPPTQFDWPPQRLEEFFEENGYNPGVIATGLTFTEEQRKEWAEAPEDQRGESLKMLSQEQWAYHVIQFTELETPATIANFLADVYGQLESADSKEWLDRILSARYQGAGAKPKRWAYLAGSPKAAGVFRFCQSHNWWLRELPWLVLFGLVPGIWITTTGRSITRQKIFPQADI